MAYFGDGGTPDALANKGQYIEFYQLVSDTSVAFRAFLTQFEDQFSSEWNEETVFGRMDPISTFKRTTRKISLGWEVVADSVQQAQNNLVKVSTLVKMLYPSYNSGAPATGGSPQPSSTHISGAPLIKLRFMNLVGDMNNATDTGAPAKESGLLGYVDGFTHAPILEEGFIEHVSSAAGGTRGEQIYPKAIQLNCTFTVLHMHELGWDENRMFRSGVGFPYGLIDETQASRLMATALGVTPEELAGAPGEPVQENVNDEANAGADEILGGGATSTEAPMSIYVPPENMSY